jgi:hypothetical protein
MANTADNFNSAACTSGPGKIYFGVIGEDLPAGGALLLGTDGSPLVSQNPNAKHVGYTEAGAEMRLSGTFQHFRADESRFPIVSRPGEEQGVISGAALQILDFDLQVVLNPLSTRRTIGGKDGITFGGKDGFSYVAVAVIFPLEGSTTLFGCFHLYKALNNAAMAAKVTTKALGSAPFAFEGHEISTRAAGDRVGQMWKQTVAGS